MNTMKKRILSSVLAVAAAASMAVPAFAAGNETEITGTYEEVEIKVLVPATATAKMDSCICLYRPACDLIHLPSTHSPA